MSVLHKLARTPLRDIFRGKLTARLDWRSVIDSAQLPAPLGQLATNVVRSTKLWRLEKADVARELCAHFSDGVKAGAGAEELTASFGDSKSAAKLITRAKRRTRPLPWRITMRALKITGALVVLVILIYGFEFIRFNTRSPNIARNYIAETNAKIEAIPEQDRAWPLYRQAILRLYPLPEHVKDIWAKSPADETWGEQVALIQEKSEALELFRQAARKPYFGRPWTTTTDPDIAIAMGDDPMPPSQNANPMLFEVLLPYLGPLRKGAQLLTADVRIAAIQKDSGRVEDNLIAVLSIASHERVQETLIDVLVDMAIYSLALSALQDILHEHPNVLSSRQLANIAHHLERGPFDVRPALQTERLVFYDIIQRAYSDDGAGDGRLTPEGLRLGSNIGLEPNLEVSAKAFTGPAFAPVIASRKTIIDKYDEIMNETERVAGLPLWQQLDFDIDGLVERLDRNMLTRLKYSPILILMPTLDRPARHAEILRLQRDGVQTIIALELYKRRENTYPETLEQLTPDLLPTLPLDGFDGKPLRYRLQDGAPLLYSVGANQLDEGGQPVLDADGDPIPDAARSFSARDKPGDWILYPPSD